LDLFNAPKVYDDKHTGPKKEKKHTLTISKPLHKSLSLWNLRVVGGFAVFKNGFENVNSLVCEST